MVAVINTGSSVRSIFNYNENKIEAGKAELIGEGNYPVAACELHQDLRLKLLLKQLELNTTVKRGSVHISLNFDPSETDLSKAKLIQIAGTYMDKIGFGAQPYLVYQHHDAGHPHIHIVTVKVKPDGRRIDMHNIGRIQSESARQEIEKTFGLLQAQRVKKDDIINIIPIKSIVAQYGRTETKKAISAVLNAVIPNYKFATIGELNAVLDLYNITAIQGGKDSRMFHHKGLAYQILDSRKMPIGVPVKASSFYSRPTLKNLELKFAINKTARAAHSKSIKNAVDLAFFQNRIKSISELDKILVHQGIRISQRRNESGLLYGITYIDHKTKCVFNGSSLGRQFSAKGIEERCGITRSDSAQNAVQFQAVDASRHKARYRSFISAETVGKIIDSILQPEFAPVYIPDQLCRKKKRKKRGQSEN